MNTSSSSGSTDYGASKQKRAFGCDDVNHSKPQNSKSVASSSHDGHREHRRDMYRKGARDRCHNDNAHMFKDVRKEQSNYGEKQHAAQFSGRLNFHEGQSAYPAYHAYNAMQPLPYMYYNHRPASDVAANYPPSYELYPAMNSVQWGGITPLDAMNRARVNASTGMSVNPNVNMNANSFPFMNITGNPNSYGMMTVRNVCQFGMLSNEGNAVMSPAKEIVHFSKCVLYPPYPNAPPPSVRQKPLGCKTIFIGGLPENITEDIIKEVFEKYGEIVVRMGTKNFCHVRFSSEAHVDSALYFSGYRIKIDNKDDSPNTGRLHVDYAESQHDYFEYECQKRSLEREARHREKFENDHLRPPTPPPVTSYSDHEAAALGEKLRNEETFPEAFLVLVTWLERGECNKRNVSYFYSLIQSANSHVHRLLNEKSEIEEEMNGKNATFKREMRNVLLYFNEVGKVFDAVSFPNVLDNFTPNQVKNINLWIKQLEEIKIAHVQEVLNERVEVEMDVSDGEDESSSKDNNKDEVVAGENSENDSSQDIDKACDDFLANAELLRSQYAAFDNEVIVLESEIRETGNLSEKQERLLNRTLQTLEEVNIPNNQTKNQAELKDQPQCKLMQLDAKELGECSQNSGVGTVRLNDTGTNSREVQKDGRGLSTSMSSPGNLTELTSQELPVMGRISSFFTLHPFGASLDYICSFLRNVDPTVEARDIEALMKKHTAVFKEESTGIGATLKKKWIFIAYQWKKNMSL